MDIDIKKVTSLDLYKILDIDEDASDNDVSNTRVSYEMGSYTGTKSRPEPSWRRPDAARVGRDSNPSRTVPIPSADTGLISLPLDGCWS